MSLFEELKRRHVFRVFGAYCAGAFILLQVTDILSSTLELPTWVAKAVLILIVVGFVPALVLAWAFQRTADGIKLDSDLDPAQVVVAPPNRKLTGITILLLLLAVGYFVADKFFWRVGAPGVGHETALDARVSLAVLPFVDMSAEGDSEYFTDGLTEELLNILAQIGPLKVAARTSSFFYKGKNVDLREMGASLGVNHILEGSVRRSGDKLRITAQLIKVEDGFHMWSETYDRTLDDIFAIQDDIAKRVAVALRAKLIGDGDPVQLVGTTQVAEAQQLFLVAQARLSHRGLENLRAARDLYKQATDLDSRFARAYVGTAMATLLLVTNHRALDPESALLEVDQAIDSALEIDPHSSEAYAVQGMRLAMQASMDPTEEGRKASVEAYRKALDLNPENTIALYWYGQSLLFRSEFEEALTYLNRALAIDPLARVAFKAKADALSALGRLDEAQAHLYHGLPLFSDYEETYGALIRLESSRGRLDRALYWTIKQMQRFGPSLLSIRSAAVLLASMGDTAGALQLVADAPESPESQIFQRLMPPLLELDFEAALPLFAEEPAFGFDFIGFRITPWVAIHAGEFETARSEWMGLRPGLYQDPPTFFPSHSEAGFALFAAWIEQKLGHNKQAASLASVVRSYLESAEGPEAYTWVHWAQLETLRENKTKAVLFLRLALQQTGGQWLAGLAPLERYVPLETLWGEPEFKALVKEIQATNAQQLANYQSGQTAQDIADEWAAAGVDFWRRSKGLLR